MATVLPALSLLVLHAASLTQATVPATGRQEVLLTLGVPGAIHLSARSASGTSCEVIDRVRGPFAKAGLAGASNCELDLLLDAGQYKVRLESATRGKGAVTLTVTEFAETTPTPVRLVPRSGVTTSLKPQQQATFWLSMASRAVPNLRVAGRHAGDVRLWRNGQWLEPIVLNHSQFSPVPGQPQHEWWLDTVLEAGEYALVVYGRDSTTVTGSSTDSSLTVEYGLREGPAERSVPFTLGLSGVLVVQVPAGDLAAVLSLDTAPTAQVSLQALNNGPRNVQNECRIAKAALVPECSVSLSVSRESLALLAVRGPPGTHGQLEWAAWRNDFDSYNSMGGYYGPSTTSYRFETPAGGGKYLVGVHDLPNDTDSAPLGCVLREMKVNGDSGRVVAHSAIRIAQGELLERDFNFPDGGAVVWFDIGEGGSLLQRAGLTSRRFRIAASGKGTCEVYRLQDDGELKRLTQAKPEGASCNELLALDPGTYQLQLQPALAGVRKLSIGEDGAKGTPVAQLGGCTLPVQALSGRYQLALSLVGDVKVRGLTLMPVPLNGGAAHVTLDARQSLAVPVSGPALVRAAAGATFACTSDSGQAVSRGSTCEIGAGTQSVVTLTNPSATPINLTLFRPGVMPGIASPASYSFDLKPLTKLSGDAPRWVDFERGQSQSVVFDVDRPGLYTATTLGLLSTSCILRSPVVDAFAKDDGGGRGRNCLVQTWLQKGRYMLTASATGQSKGRAALVLSRRSVREFPGLSGDGEQFFRVDANELVQQKLEIRVSGTYQLSTAVQGVPGLACRIDDPEGWPIEPVPTSCSGERTLRAGKWLWTQLPLTVESMRHTTVSKPREEVTLKGNTKTHPLDFFTWYRAELGSDGKDDFTFTLEGETELDVVLTNGMQGRIFLLEKDKPPKAVEVIPPLQVEPTPDEEVAPEGESEGESQPEASDGQAEYSEDGEERAPPQPQVPVVRADSAPPPPSGVKVRLPAGQYKLLTEHSRADVGVEYRLHLGSATLLPGMTRTLPTPSRIPVFIPRDGTLRLRTTGDSDVRCRLFDQAGKLAFEGSENGADWNCALAEPVKKGSYTLVLEAETQQRGETKLSLALPPVDDKGALTEGAKATLGAAIVSWRVPVPEKDAVQEVSLVATSRTPLSCAVEDASGEVVYRQSRVAACSLLVRPMNEQWRVRAWSTDGSASVQVGFRSRPVVDGGQGEAPAEKAVQVKVSRAGRFGTSASVFCLPSSQRGLLLPCGPEVSLEAGAVIFSTTGTSSRPLPLSEVLASASDAAVDLGLARQPWIQNVIAPKPSLFLLEARVQHGERVAPSCAFDGAGVVRERRETACFAASRVGTTATARLWAAADQPISARVVRSALALPDKYEPLATGRRHLALAQGVGRFGLPKSSRARLELTIGKGAWAVLLDDTGAALDLCAPSSNLRRCILTGQGGSVAIFAGEQSEADVTTVLLEGTPQAVAFTGLYEDSPRQPGTVRLNAAPAESERAVTIEGALSCTVALSDGVRIASCRAKVPAEVGVELVIEHGVGPLRAMVHAPGRERQARLGIDLPVVPGPSLTSAVAVPLQAGRIDRTLLVDKEAVVRISAESGVCGLYRGPELLSVDGLDSGCELVRVLSPGNYRLLVRPFAGRVTPGSMRWTAEPVAQLGEGIGQEEWLAPGEARLFRFDTDNAGKVGLGVQAKSELVECAVYNDAYQLVGEGCHQYLTLAKGRFLLTVRNPPAPGAVPRAFKPVLLGLAGEKNDIPDEYLNDFFRRVEVRP